MYFNDNLSSIISKYKGKYKGSLEEYLIGVYRAIEEHEDNRVSDNLVLDILEEGFSRKMTNNTGFREEPVKDHYPKCKYIGHCGDICDEIQDEKEHKQYKKTKLKKGEYGLYKIKRTLEEFIDTTREMRYDKNQDPFIFLENIILSNYDSIDVYSSDDGDMRGSNETQITEWSDFAALLKGGWNLERVKNGYNFGIYKIIIYVLAALIVVPQMMNDKLMSPIRSIKYFGILALIYLIFCYAARLATGRGTIKVSDNFKISKIELIVHLIIIIIGFIL